MQEQGKRQTNAGTHHPIHREEIIPQSESGENGSILCRKYQIPLDMDSTKARKDSGCEVHRKTKDKMKAKDKELTSRRNIQSYEEWKKKLKQFIVGWINYYKLADMGNLLKNTDEWMRRRIRYGILETLEKSKNKIPESGEVGTQPLQCRYSSEFKKRLLAK